MANEIPVGGNALAQDQPAPVTVPAAAPVVPVVAPVAAPVSDVAPAPTPEPVSTAPAPAPEVKAEGAAEPPKVEAPAEEKKAEAASPEPEVKTAPVYTEFKMPEGFKAEPAQISAYSNILGKYNIPQEAGQELIDFHTGLVKQAQQAADQHQREVFAETRRNWTKQVDKEFGNQRDTVLNDARSVISQYAGGKKQLAEAWEVLAFTGAGDHPAMVRLFRNIKKALSEREAPPMGLPFNPDRSGSPADRRYRARN